MGLGRTGQAFRVRSRGYRISSSQEFGMPEDTFIAIVGPTASGKGTLARAIAGRLGAEILSVDSMKVYRGLDIGTAKPRPEQRGGIRHHLIDLVDPSESYHVAAFVEAAVAAEREVRGRGALPLYVGGSALYLKALRDGLFPDPGEDREYRGALRERAEREGAGPLHAELARIDPESADRIHPNDLKRVVRALEVYRVTGETISARQARFRGRTARPCRWIGVRWARDALDRRIDLRVNRMIEAGLVDEVDALRAADAFGPPASVATSLGAIGYREILAHLDGAITLEEARAEIQLKTRQFARRQLTWFRSFTDIHWIDREEGDDHAALEERVLEIIRAA
jgi:tRNA dimethylallyltransferase